MRPCVGDIHLKHTNTATGLKITRMLHQGRNHAPKLPSALLGSQQTGEYDGRTMPRPEAAIGSTRSAAQPPIHNRATTTTTTKLKDRQEPGHRRNAADVDGDTASNHRTQARGLDSPAGTSTPESGGGAREPTGSSARRQSLKAVENDEPTATDHAADLRDLYNASRAGRRRTQQSCIDCSSPSRRRRCHRPVLVGPLRFPPSHGRRTRRDLR